MYPDVKNAVEKGHLESGYAHYLKNGIKEGRQPAWKKNIKDNYRFWPWSDSYYLSHNPEIINCLIDLTPSEHYKTKGEKQGLATGLEPIQESFLKKTTLPTWAAIEMQSLSYFEPGLDLESYNRSTIYNPFAKSDYTRSFPLISKYLRYDKYDFLFFLPWIKKGGADLAALFHINSAVKSFDRIAIFTCEDVESEWKSTLPKSVDLIELGILFRNIPKDIQLQLYYHLICALGPKKNSYY